MKIRESLKTRDLAPWLLLPGVVLALGSVSVLVPYQAALGATPNAAAAPLPASLPSHSVTTGTLPAAYDDGDGDELLEHWGDPKYSHEAQAQMAGIALGFLVLGVLQSRRRRSKSHCEIVPMPSEADFLKLDSRKAA